MIVQLASEHEQAMFVLIGAEQVALLYKSVCFW